MWLVWLVRCGVLALALVGVVALAPRWFARPLLLADTSGAADAIVVLGGSVTPPCTADPVSQALASHARRLYQGGRARLVVFAGGRGDAESCPVAQVMADLAVQSGVPADRVRVETTSTSTRESAVRTDAVLLTLGVSRVLLVTPALKMRRAETSFKRVGYEIERASVPQAEAAGGRFAMTGAVVGGYLAWAADSFRGRPGAESGVNRSHVLPPAAGVVSHASMAPGGQANSDGPIVLFGTSYAASWTLNRVGGVPIVNKGHGGDRTDELLARFGKDVLAIKPRAAIIWGFDNDLFDPPGGDMAVAMRNVQDNMLRMVDLAATHGIEPILATEVTMRPLPGLREGLSTAVLFLLGRPTFQDRINRQVLDGNVWLRELARQRQLILLDFQPLLSDRFQHRYPPFAKPDGTHITAAGYAVLSAYIERALGPHFGSGTGVVQGDGAGASNRGPGTVASARDQAADAGEPIR